MAHEMQERPSSANAKRPHSVRAGSKDSMEVCRIGPQLVLVSNQPIFKVDFLNRNFENDGIVEICKSSVEFSV